LFRADGFLAAFKRNKSFGFSKKLRRCELTFWSQHTAVAAQRIGRGIRGIDRASARG
jgi:hypothetical protein